MISARGGLEVDVCCGMAHERQRHLGSREGRRRRCPGETSSTACLSAAEKVTVSERKLKCCSIDKCNLDVDPKMQSTAGLSETN